MTTHTPTQQFVLRAMAKNYSPDRFIGDHLDIEVFIKAADEIALLLSENEALRKALEATPDPRPALAAAHKEEDDKWKEASKATEKWSDRSWQAGRASGLAAALQIYDQVLIAADVRAFEASSLSSTDQTPPKLEPFRCYCRTQFERSHCAYFKDGNCGRTQYAVAVSSTPRATGED